MTDSSKTAILKQIGALLYVCFSFLFFKEDKVSVQKLAAAALGFMGILAINTDGGPDFRFHLGDVLILAASFCTVFSNVISKKAMTAVAPVTLTGISQLFGGVVLLAIGTARNGSMDFSIHKGFIFAYICLASIVSYCLWFTVVKNGELSKLFIIKFAEPAFACVFGALILGENIWRIPYLIAFILIAAGVVLANSANLKRKP